MKAARILLVAANPAVAGDGSAVGFWAGELTHPYFVFREHGCDVTIASNDGGRVVFDAFSDPRHPSGHSKDDLLSLGFMQRSDLRALLENTVSLSQVSNSDHDAIFVAGGVFADVPFVDGTRRRQLAGLLLRTFREVSCELTGSRRLIPKTAVELRRSIFEIDDLTVLAASLAG